jgi:hypothetical protein
VCIVTARKVNYDAIAHTVRKEGKLTFGELATRWNLSPSTAYAVLRIIPQAYPDIIRVGDTLMTPEHVERAQEQYREEEK